jgi:hypothetical protein
VDGEKKKRGTSEGYRRIYDGIETYARENSPFSSFSLENPNPRNPKIKNPLYSLKRGVLPSVGLYTGI